MVRGGDEKEMACGRASGAEGMARVDGGPGSRYVVDKGRRLELRVLVRRLAK
jgi:hypothetical protein